MHSCQQVWEIGNYFIDRPLIERLENYIIKDIPGILQVASACGSSVRMFKKNMNIIFCYQNSQEQFNSISAYKFSLFPDNIKAITLKTRLAQAQCSRHFEITIQLSHIAEDCQLSINLTDEYPKEKLEVIQSGLLSIMKLNKKKALSLHYVLPAIMITVMAGLTITTIHSHTFFEYKFIYISFALWMLLFLLVIRSLKGKCVFDTRQQTIKDQWYNWLVSGTAGFILFSTLMASFRKVILGF